MDGRIETRNHWPNAAHSLLVGTVLYVIYDWPRKSLANQIGRVLTERPDDGSTKNRRVLFLFDEFPALGRLEFFESALAYMAGYGLKAFLICQSLNQLQKAYGERNSILDNCHVRVAFANNDDQTARRLSDLLGEATATKEQISISGGRFAMFFKNASVSQVQYARPLLLPSEINRLPADQELILVNGVLPILARKIRYYQDACSKDRLYPPIILAPRDRSTVITNKSSISELAVIPSQSEPIGSAL